MFMLSILVGCSIMFETDKVPFRRKVQDGEMYRYSLSHSVSKVVKPSVILIEERIDRARTDGTVEFSLNANSVASGSKAKLPLPLQSRLSPPRLPEGLSMSGTGFYYVFFAIASQTAGRDVSLNEKLPINYTTKDGRAEFAGSGIIQEIDGDKRVLTVRWEVVLRIQGTDAADISLTSIYSTDDGSLVRSDGVLSTKGVVSSQPIEIARIRK